MDKLRQQESLIEQALQLYSEKYNNNKEFNDYYDSLVISLDQLGLKNSLVLFWGDLDSYNNEMAEWENQEIESQHADCKELLSSGNADQTLLFKDVIEAVRRRRIVPFVGAGFSKYMGMPLWHEALQEIHDKQRNPQCDVFDKYLNEGHYLDAAQLLADKDQDVMNNFIRTKFRVQKIEGPVQLLPMICNGCVVTTNFDDSIEEVFKQADKGFDAYMHGTQQHTFFSRLVKGDRCILKIHGDADDNPDTFVFTQSQYENAYGNPFDFTKSLPKALRQIFVSNSLLFVGCSLDQDWTLKLFKAVRDQDEYELPTHYAILEEPPQEEILEKEADLLKCNIHPIWYPAKEYDSVEKLLNLIIDAVNGRINL
ncbi:SIR2 family protein [Methanococcoides orientis]|uniref:SIR2 family NAD-dependent protein deacylase n=1 Tax=Methanococcoides orientis TaxID=2822137 RepID=UPI001E5B39C7|nr:SIR2 family protein [Methanococcoides orientis]UGV39825.1 SIR2 family protein [Methanococcoides orientis]